MKRKYLLLLTLLVPSLTWAQDQEVRLTTSRATGQTLTMQVNRTLDGVTVDWGDGTPVDYPRTESALTTISGTLKGQTVVLRGSASLNTLICENADLTEAEVKNAKSLRSLYLQNNKLTNIDLTTLASLTDLDLSGNQITTLSLSESKNPKLENVNLSGNGMEKIGSNTSFVFRSGTLQHLNVSGNKFKTVYTTQNVNLDALFCASNQLTVLDVSRATKLSTIVCSDNAITRMTLPADGLPELCQLVCDNNAIASLDLSASKNLADLSVANNGMSSLLFPSLKFNSFSCGGNSLTFRALPIARNQPDEGYFFYLPQADFDVRDKLTKSTKYEGGYYLPVCPGYSSRNNADYILDLSELRTDGSGRASVNFAAVSIDADGTEHELTPAKAADPNQDYTQTQGKLTFLKGYPRVCVQLTHSDYPELVIRSKVFAVGEDNLVAVQTPELNTLDATLPSYDLQGRRVREPKQGIYIQNGKKVLF